MDLSGRAPEVIAAVERWLREPAPQPLVVATSGSTGRPKRVVLSREAVLASVHATTSRLGGQGRWLLTLPATYVAGTQVICRSLVAGEPPVLVEDHRSFAAAVAATAPRFTSLVPTQLHRMLDAPDDVAALRSLDTVLIGGGPLDAGLRARAGAAGVRVVATYGAAETAGGCVYDGRGLDGVRLEVEDDGAHPGRLRVAGPTLFDGYEADPELTSTTLVDGWYLTQDAAVLEPDGTLRVLGRLDDVVLSGGVNVPAPAVAERLRAHPQVRAVEVLGVPDPEWGARLVAFVVGPVSAEAVRDWVAQAHPRAWQPRQVVSLTSLPLLANGKPDRVALRGLASESGAG